MELKDFLVKLEKELDNDITEQRRRYLENYQEELKSYISNHPDVVNIPTPLELYCNLHPEAPECLKYDV